MKWDDYDDYGETYDLLATVNSGWDWEWPGWEWVADRLNDEHGNNRSAAACRSKYYREENNRAAVRKKQGKKYGIEGK